MLSKLTQTVKRHSLRQQMLRNFAEASGFLKGHKAPTIFSSSVAINIENVDGTFSRIFALVGQPLWNELGKNNINIGGDCGGGQQDSLRERPVENHPYGPACGLCYCVIDEPWYSKLGEINWNEVQALLQLAEDYPQNTRFACSLVVEKWMNEMVIRIPTIKDSERAMADHQREFS